MSDDDIDYSDIPPLTDEQLSAMRPLRELFPELAHHKKMISVDILTPIYEYERCLDKPET